MSHLRSQVHKEIVEDLAQKHELDPKKEVEEMWKTRKVRTRRTSSYGSGTFIVLGRSKSGSQGRGGLNKQAQELLDRLKKQRNRRNQQGNSGGTRRTPRSPGYPP